MAYIDVRAQDRGATLPDAESAILRVIALRKSGKEWNFGGKPFGQTIDLQRRINDAIARKDFTAFKATQRRGYWRVELA